MTQLAGALHALVARHAVDSRRRAGLAVALALAVAGTAAAHEGHEPGAAQPTGALEVALVSSELLVGPNRFAFGLFDPEGVHVQEALVHLHYFDLRDPNAPRLESEADAAPLTTPDGFTTVYTHERSFPWAGQWGVEIQASLPDGSRAVRRVAFDVVARGQAPAPGDAVPRLRTPTVADVGGDLRLLTSAADPAAELYATSLDASLASGRPTVILFATPGFCRTRFCGPAYQVVRDLQERYGQRVDFIHVEIFAGLPNPAAHGWPLAPTVRAFGLTSEPWLYLVDPEGIVTYRVEGVFGEHEVEPHLRSVLAP